MRLIVLPAGLAIAAPLMLAAGPALQSSPDLGKAEGRCRPGEGGPALLVEAVGMKDRAGLMKLEVYPANDQDFLADDNVLVAAGKTFRRVEIATPQAGAVVLCVRIPGPGTYAVSLLHDRNVGASLVDRLRARSYCEASASPPASPPRRSPSRRNEHCVDCVDCDSRT